MFDKPWAALLVLAIVMSAVPKGRWRRQAPPRPPRLPPN